MKTLLDIIVESLEDIGNIDRSHMPQVDTENLPDAIEKVANTLSIKKGMVRVGDLKKTQKQLIPDKIKGIADKKLKSESDVKDMKPIIISNDNHIVDGHHRWAGAAYKFGQDIKVPTYQIQAPIKDALVLYSQIAKEVQPLSEAMVLTDLRKKFNIELDLFDNGKYLTLSRIVVPKEQRGKGIGEKVMNLITKYADSQEKSVYLTPDTAFGATSKGRLEKFYKQFGFKKKPKSDFTARESMVRYPLSETNEAASPKQAVFNGKVHKFITGKNLKVDGKRIPEVDFEVTAIDNQQNIVNLTVMAPSELAGREMRVPFRSIRRGPFFKTAIDNQLGEDRIDEIPMADLIAVDDYADDVLDPIDVVITDKHFFDRVRDPRNGKEITDTELMDFFDRLAEDKEKFIAFLEKYNKIVVTDVETNINIPFMKKANKAIAKTIMRTRNFKHRDKEMKI